MKSVDIVARPSTVNRQDPALLGKIWTMHADQARAGKVEQSDVVRSDVWLSLAILSAASIVVRLIGLDHLPRNDELYTVLAARGWLADGVPRIADGIYDRALLYTIIVANFFEVFGESLVVARLPSVIAGSLLVVAVFAWTRAVAGSLPAWIAALFVCFSPLSIQLSQYARFYTLQALTFWLGAVGIYALMARSHSWRTALPTGIGAGVCLALALLLQQLTVIGLVGISFWLGLFILVPWLWSQRPTRLWPVVATGTLLALLGALLLIESGIAEQLWQRYRWAPLHALPRSSQVWFYHLQLIERYPLLWPIFPFLALAAIAACPRPAIFSCCVLIVAFGALSIAAQKHFNYVFFALPFLFVVWGISLSGVMAVLWRWIVTVTDHAVAQIAPGLPQRPTRWALVTAGLLFLLVSNGAPARTILKPFGVALESDETAIDWAPVKAALEPWLEKASVVLTPNDMHALYYIGNYDVAVNPSRLSEIPEGEEFSLDRRTGRPVVGTAASLELIMSCYASGVLIADDTSFPLPWVGSEHITTLIRSTMTPIELPRGAGIHAFRWATDGEAPVPADCAGLPVGRDRAHHIGKRVRGVL